MEDKWKATKTNAELITQQRDNDISLKSPLKIYNATAEGYVCVTQAGISRIFKDTTPQNIQGFYTDGLQTCLGILLIGKEAASLIHLTHKMAIRDVLKEKEKTGE